MDEHQTILPNYDSPDENKLDVHLKNYDNFVVHNWDNIEHAMLVVDGDDARDNSSNHDNDSSIVTASVVAAAMAMATADYLHSKVLVDIRCVEERDDDCEDGTMDADHVVVVLDDKADIGYSFQMTMSIYLYS